MQLPIYLDYMATTPVDRRVIEKMRTALESPDNFGNSTSEHYYGWQARELIEAARQQVASLVNSDTREIIWTSGATEANNLALKGAAFFYHRKGKHIITLSSEHKSVLDVCNFLASQGFEITYLKPEPNGRLDINKLKDALRLDTLLVSIMHVNNETGIIQDLAAIGEVVKQKGALFHVDAAQSAGKIPIDLQKLPVDLLSLSAHKIYGPKGVGALYVRRQPRVRLLPQILGGGQEWGIRAGTVPTHQVLGMGEAFAIAQQEMQTDYAHALELRNLFWKGISSIPEISLNGDLNYQVPNCLNICVKGISNETLLASLPDFAISTGSACNAADPDPSHVLLSMGLTRQQANQSIRISFGRFTTRPQIEKAIEQLTKTITLLH